MRNIKESFSQREERREKEDFQLPCYRRRTHLGEGMKEQTLLFRKVACVPVMCDIV